MEPIVYVVGYDTDIDEAFEVCRRERSVVVWRRSSFVIYSDDQVFTSKEQAVLFACKMCAEIIKKYSSRLSDLQVTDEQ